MAATRPVVVVVLAAVLCLALLANEAASDRSADAIGALRQRSRAVRQQRAAAAEITVGAGVAGVSLLSNIADKITSAVTEHKAKAHQADLAAQIKASKDLWCSILLIQAEAEAQRFAQAALIIKSSIPIPPAPVLSPKKEQLKLFYDELYKFGLSISTSKHWTETQLLSPKMCPDLQPFQPPPGVTGDADAKALNDGITGGVDVKVAKDQKAGAAAAYDPDVTGEAEVRAHSTLPKVLSIYSDAQKHIAGKLAELGLVLGVSLPPSFGGAAAAAAKKPQTKLQEQTDSFLKMLEDNGKKAAQAAASGVAQEVAVNAVQHVGGAAAGAVIDTVVPVTGVASTGSNLFAMGSTISDYNTEWEHDELNKKEFLADASYAACNLVLTLFRDSCRFIVSDALFDMLLSSNPTQAQTNALLVAWRNNPLGVLAAYVELGCPSRQHIQQAFSPGWKAGPLKEIATINPNSKQPGRVADLFPAFRALFEKAKKVDKYVIALSDVEVIDKAKYGFGKVAVILTPKGELEPMPKEYMDRLIRVPLPIINFQPNHLLKPIEEPITGIEVIHHDAAQVPSGAGILYNDRRPGKAFHDTAKTQKHQAQLKAKGFNQPVLELTSYGIDSERVSTELHIRRSRAGIPVSSFYLIHNEKGTREASWTAAQTKVLESKDRLIVRSDAEMTIALRKQETSTFFQKIGQGFYGHDFFYFCAEKDPTLYWDPELNTLVTASRRKIFVN